MKFICEKDKTKNKKDNHWTICERRKLPYILISDINQEYSNIFYDITNLDLNLEFI